MGENILIYCGNCYKSKDNLFKDDEYEIINGKFVLLKNNAFKKSFTLGGGFISPESIFYGKYFKKPIIFDLIKKKSIKEDIKNLIKNNAKIIDAYHSIYFCPKCHDISNKYYFKMEFNGVYEPKYYCRYCKSKLENIDYELENEEKVIFKNIKEETIEISCKKCGSNNLLMEHLAFWD